MTKEEIKRICFYSVSHLKESSRFCAFSSLKILSLLPKSEDIAIIIIYINYYCNNYYHYYYYKLICIIYIQLSSVENG
jgi:hypothetical protein